MPLILASTSPIRLDLLQQAGVAVRVVAPRVDEDRVKRDHDGDATSLALRLAEAKALSLARPGDWVIGSDSTLAVERRSFSKPADRAEAQRHLAYFSGKRESRRAVPHDSQAVDDSSPLWRDCRKVVE